jgi:tetrahydromethanopterin S-methyltransferase subunit G
MSKVESYKAEIRIEEARRDYLILKKCKLMSDLEPDGIKVTGSYLDADNIHGNNSKAFEDILPKIMAIQAEINQHNKQIDLLNKLIRCVETDVDKIQCIDKKVEYLKTHVGYSLQEIATRLGYSYNYIKKISASIGKQE